MKKIFLFNIFLILLNGSVYSQLPSIQWQKTYGGSTDDAGYSICLTINGGYAVTGVSTSSNGYIVNAHGNHDVWLIVLDSVGNLLWNKCYGGNSFEIGYSILNDKVNSFVIACSANYNNGDVSGWHGSSDFWILKVDQNGILQWQKCLGGTGRDVASSIIQTNDSGYLVSGATQSYDFDVHGVHGGDDMWVVKLNQNGMIEWSKALGGTFYEGGNSCIQLSNGNYLIAGPASSNDGNATCNNNSSTDVWVVALDTAGNLLWQRCYGGSGIDNTKKIIATPDGGFYVTAWTNSTNGDVSNNHGQDDYWLIKADSIGNIQWEKCFGGMYGEAAYSATLTNDGGIVMVGVSTIDDGMVSGNHNSLNPSMLDYWVVKADTLGNFEWGKCFGGSQKDIAYDVKQTPDGGFIIAGSTESTDGDVTDTLGGMDVWVVKLSNPTAGILIPESGLMEFSASQVNDKIVLRFFSKRNVRAAMKLYDLNGRLISESEIQINEGVNYHSQICSGLPEGMYVVEILGKNLQQCGKVFVRKVN